ncbi:hypothetical protein Lalb_Chr17g0347961 [Lupinus albus]|uniref:Uncharacterized protein n=1 Tax=Lupinus albus TaxID=3870 RepID=A0A6A4P3W6_LUPAL|nr:hypothetical protein Lalb_Chr17g0347961 [Lupinus albus]
MGNTMTPCFLYNKTLSSSSSSSSSSKSTVKLIFWEGTSRSLKGKHIAGEIMFEFPENMVCHADSFFIASSLAALGSCASNKSPIKFGACPFEYLKGSDGRVLIKVMPEFITRLISGENNGSSSNSFLCSTPELQKQYEHLVKSKDQTWSPKLETISEYKRRSSPCRFIGLEWKEKEKSEEIFTRL